MSARKPPAPVSTKQRPPQFGQQGSRRKVPPQIVIIRLPWLEAYRRHPPSDTAAYDLPRLYAPAPSLPPPRAGRDGPAEKY